MSGSWNNGRFEGNFSLSQYNPNIIIRSPIYPVFHPLKGESLLQGPPKVRKSWGSQVESLGLLVSGVELERLVEGFRV